MGLAELQKAVIKMDGKKILSFLGKHGIDRNDARLEKIEFSEVVPISLVNYPKAKIDPNTVLYFYDGPLDSKTRPFCAALLRLNKYFTQADLDLLSSYLGYDVFLYEGTFNCRHTWKYARIKGKLISGLLPDLPSRGAINRVSVKQPTGVAKYF